MASVSSLGIDGAYHDITRPPGVIMLEDIKRVAKPVLKNGSAAVWDIGDGVLCFEFTSKSNSLDDKIIELLDKTIDLVQQKYKALVIYNEGRTSRSAPISALRCSPPTWPPGARSRRRSPRDSRP